MSYRRNVAIGMKKEDGVRFLSEFVQSVPDSSLLDEGFTMRQYPEYLVFTWQDVKWYPEYRDVAWVDAFLKELVESDKPAAFVTVGEADDDCEAWYANDENYDLYNLFWLNRSIGFAPTAEGGV